MEYTGILRKVDLGSGGWRLECSDGKSYDLTGEVSSEYENKNVTVKAKPIEGMGFMMGEQILEVESIKGN